MGTGTRFIAVDVWRPAFDRPSVKAIFELYQTHSKCSDEQLRRVELRSAVDYLRKLEDPFYEPRDLN